MEEGGIGYFIGDWVGSGEKCVVLSEPGEFFEISVWAGPRGKNRRGMKECVR